MVKCYKQIEVSRTGVPSISLMPSGGSAGGGVNVGIITGSYDGTWSLYSSEQSFTMIA